MIDHTHKAVTGSWSSPTNLDNWSRRLTEIIMVVDSKTTLVWAEVATRDKAIPSIINTRGQISLGIDHTTTRDRLTFTTILTTTTITTTTTASISKRRDTTTTKRHTMGRAELTITRMVADLRLTFHAITKAIDMEASTRRPYWTHRRLRALPASSSIQVCTTLALRALSSRTPPTQSTLSLLIPSHMTNKDKCPTQILSPATSTQSSIRHLWPSWVRSSRQKSTNLSTW
jgi:hypothetical protein